MVANKALIFKAVPDGAVVPGQHLVLEVRDFDIDQAPPPGGLTTKNFYASFDPYQRGRMAPPGTKSHIPPFVLGEPIANYTIAKVIKSDHEGYEAGDIIVGVADTAEYSVITKFYLENYSQKLDNPLGLDEVLFIGPLGMPGLSAYSSLYDIGKPIKGETMFVSGAAGAVGQIAGQLAKHEGLRVIGSVGSSEKLDFITKELGFDGGFNYKSEDPKQALKQLAPNGIDIYFDNVGAEQLDAALENMNDFGRIVACGMVSRFTTHTEEPYGVKNLPLFIRKRLTMRGFIVSDKNMGPVYAKEHLENVSRWIKDGSFKTKISITQGIENGAEAFVGMLQGKNFGKAVLKIADLRD